MSVAFDDGKMSGIAQNTVHCFIYCTKAFDRVNPDTLHEILSKAGFQTKK